MTKLSTYAVASAACAVGMVCHAVRTRRQFYPVMMYLANSKISLVLFSNLGLVMMGAIWQSVNAVFLGPLREAEVERLNEQCWREVMEILFAMTVFRDEFDVQFVFLVTLLLFVKAYHWLAQKRVAYVETTPSLPRLSHVRLCTFMALLFTLDCLFFHGSFSHLLKTRQASVSLFFAFEYAILATSTLATSIKYALHLREMLHEGRWIGKAVCIFYLELVQDLLHLSLYLLFFLVIFMHYGLPLHLVRELHETFRSFKNRIADFIRYRRLASNLNERFPDATPAEISRDATCIVCREEMILGAKKLPCGHLFHVHCLRSWLERQHTCPTCRAPVLGSEDESLSDEDQAPDLNPFEEDEFGLTNDNTMSGQEGVDDATYVGDPSLNLTQLQRATTTAAAHYGQSLVYPSFVNGTTTWYPMYVPVVFQPHVQPDRSPFACVVGGGRGIAPLESISNNPIIEDNIGQNIAGPGAFSDHIQYPYTQRWAHVPLVSRMPECSGQYTMPSLRHRVQLPAAVATRETPSPVDTTMGKQAASTSPGSLASTVTWVPGSLDVSRRLEQLSYLERVAKVLQRQLELTVELQHRVNSMTDDPRGTSETNESKIAQQHATDENNLSNPQNLDKKGKSPIRLVKDHCEHCSST